MGTCAKRCSCCKCGPVCNCDPCTCCQCGKDCNCPKRCECCKCDPCTCHEEEAKVQKKSGCGCKSKKVEEKKSGCGNSSKKVEEKKSGCGCSSKKVEEKNSDLGVSSTSPQELTIKISNLEQIDGMPIIIEYPGQKIEITIKTTKTNNGSCSN